MNCARWKTWNTYRQGFLVGKRILLYCRSFKTRRDKFSSSPLKTFGRASEKKEQVTTDTEIWSERAEGREKFLLHCNHRLFLALLSTEWGLHQLECLTHDSFAAFSLRRMLWPVSRLPVASAARCWLGSSASSLGKGKLQSCEGLAASCLSPFLHPGRVFPSTSHESYRNAFFL